MEGERRGVAMMNRNEMATAAGPVEAIGRHRTWMHAGKRGMAMCCGRHETLGLTDESIVHSTDMRQGASSHSRPTFGPSYR